MWSLNSMLMPKVISVNFLFISSELVCAHTDKESRQLYIQDGEGGGDTQIQVTLQKINTLVLFEKTKYLHGIVHRRKIQIRPPSLSKRINYNNYNNY